MWSCSFFPSGTPSLYFPSAGAHRGPLPRARRPEGLRARVSGENAPGPGTHPPVICYYEILLVFPLWYTSPLFRLGRSPPGAPSPSPGARGSPGPVFRGKCSGPWNTLPRDMLLCEVARFSPLVPLPFTSPRPEPTRGPFPEPGGPEYGGRYPSARGPGRARLARSGGDGGSLKNSACPRSVASVIPS